MKKKLAILIYSLASGGAERVVATLLKSLQQHFDMHLVLMNDTIFYDIPSNIPITYLQRSKPTQKSIYKLLALPLLAITYRKFCQQHSIDLSLSFMNRPNYINIMAKLIGTNTQHYISERIAPSAEYATSSLKDCLSRWLITTLYPKADKIIPNAKGIAQDLIANFHIRANLISTIYNPLDITKINDLKKHALPPKMRFINDKFTFITVGRLQPQKNHRLLIDAFALIQDTQSQLLIIGDGELRGQLQTQIDNYNLQHNIHLLGKQTNPYNFMHNATVFVLSSNYEGFPNVLLEALACELPIISTDCLSGPKEIIAPHPTELYTMTQHKAQQIVTEQFGVLTPPQQVKDLSIAMKLLRDDTKLRVTYQQKAFLRATNFAVADISKQWLTLCR